MTNTNYQKETLAIHAGQKPDPATGARAEPIYMTTAYVFRDAEQAAGRFSLTDAGNIYTRLTNPNNSSFEEKIAALEGGTAAISTASGMAAISYAILAVTNPGDEIVSADNLYGGTYELFHHTLPNFGRTVTFVKSDDLVALKNAITPKTRAVYFESIGNPKLDIPDFEAVAKIAHDAGVPFIVDNTVGVGTVKPLDHGADIVVMSATKYVNGHGTALAGVIIEGGKFPWDNGKFPKFTTPDPAYHGLVHYSAFGPATVSTSIRVSLMRDVGATLSPFNAWLSSLGLETLYLRIQRHAENALAVAEHLKNHPKVAWVNYPGLADHPSRKNSVRYFGGSGGPIVTFGVKGGYDAAVKVQNSVQLFSLLANIGDAKSLIIHPASTTHQQLSPEEQLSTGVAPDTIRLAIGLENSADIIADLDLALAQV
ncbi:O-acetylhomoserine aminocarboxypropyltransferase/cysteine synthase family protein [Methanorbis rubei]|uniref:O-acetyl-L-homoserine sulfhydrylase n=1 Tax=Methanorbis rubei TaxID=3028300 RepID=A0AAE4SAH7_9EURY|nr:O-acetyl-L-homoserine sulfhydrylase [Methanocorpusculaceae archaeon Cs1]